MIYDKNDPTGHGLFSKCGRNHAAKYVNNKKLQATSLRSKKSSYMTSSIKQTQKKLICPFDMIESRYQRQKKYQKQETPAVGQYNPKIEKKIKLTWDILKAHHNKTVGKKNPQPPKEMKKKQEKSGQNMTEVEENIHHSESGLNQKLQVQNTFNEFNTQKEKKTFSENKRYQTVKSVVDMSRMTGRQSSKFFTVQEDNYTEDEIDINKSIKCIKTETSKKIVFEKQLSREKVQSVKKKLTIPSDYSYDISFIKKKEPGIVKFKNMVGRKQRKNRILQYGYSHYDYDAYVWKGNSKIFPNTKTSVTDFNHQTNRSFVIKNY